jgi:hypothetical protein
MQLICSAFDQNPDCKPQGYLSALMGNTLMCSHFANRGERSAVNVQLVGILNNMLVLLQARMSSNSVTLAMLQCHLGTQFHAEAVRCVG